MMWKPEILMQNAGRKRIFLSKRIENGSRCACSVCQKPNSRLRDLPQLNGFVAHFHVLTTKRASVSNGA